MTNGRSVFVNLPVRDLDRSVEFFTKLGFTFDPRFTDETATMMVIGDQAFAMLVTEDRFKTFTDKEVCDTYTHTEALLGISARSRQEVDDLVDTALAAGGSPAGDPEDHGWMYGWSFQDPDRHTWELVWMDPSAYQD